MLPKIDLPIFETKLPSTQENIKYRPFTVKEEKIMLVAGESKDMMQQLSKLLITVYLKEIFLILQCLI